MPFDLQDWTEHLQKSGCRLTMPRQAVIATLREMRYPLSPLEIYDQARQHYRRLGVVTVYRTLERLEQLSLIRRVSLGKGLAYFPAYVGADAVLLCRLCGHVEQIQEQTLMLLLQHVGQKLGYQIIAQTLEITGTCANCLQETNFYGETA